jgi:hypothetical protein
MSGTFGFMLDLSNFKPWRFLYMDYVISPEEYYLFSFSFIKKLFLPPPPFFFFVGLKLQTFGQHL